MKQSWDTLPPSEHPPHDSHGSTESAKQLKQPWAGEKFFCFLHTKKKI
jgi:hypothetical protein